MEVPEYEIFYRPKSEKRDEGSERLMSSASWVGNKDIEAEKHQQEQSEKVKQDQHSEPS